MLSCIMHIMNRQPSFVKTIASALTQRCLVKRHSKLIVAVSGGADSVALLRAMVSLSDRRGREMTLVVAHVNHHLRKQSDDDEKFVGELAAQHNLLFFHADLAPPKEQADNVEQWARDARYAALTQVAMSQKAHVLTAHHADDQLETMLMRLMRGSGAKGLAGMRWYRPLSPDSGWIQLLRPMLGVTHQDALDYLASLNQSWCEDHTNADVTRLRAAIRATVVPQLKALAPQISQRVMHTSDHLHDVAFLLKMAIDRHIDTAVSRQDGAVIYQRAESRITEDAVLQGALHRLLIEAGVPADSLRREAVLKLAHALQDKHGKTRTYEFAGGVLATLDKTLLKIQQQ